MENKKEKNALRCELLMIPLFLIVSAAYLLIISFTTSPLYEKSLIGNDSMIFMMLGKFTKAGMIPYKEFFDHKGPMIVFVEYIGFLIHDGRIGVFLIQIIFFTASLYGAYKILRLFYDKKTSLLFNILFLMLCSIFWEGGNLTEEYCLPFLMWSAYFAVKYFKVYLTEDKNHNPWYSFLYGITFMMGSFTRITNALPMCIMVLVSFCILIYKKKWKNIIQNILMFLLGCGVILVPCIIYFVKNNALNEMLYATFIYNFRYAASNTQGRTLNDLVRASIYYVPLITSFIIGVYGVISKGREKIISICIIVSSAVGILLQLSGEQYAHYLIIWIPVLILAIGIFGDMKEKNQRCNVVIAMVILCMVGLLYKNVKVAGDAYHVYSEKGAAQYTEESNEIVNLIPEDERDLVMAYNVNARFYLVTNITPCYKYCILQDWQCSKDDKIQEEFKNDILSLEAKYIVVNNNQKNSLDNMINENYDRVGNTDKLVLLKRK